jgi:hypothetical protein
MNRVIWCERNDWIFNYEDSPVGKCKDKFIKEFILLLHRAKKYFLTIEQWLEDLAQPP